MPIYSSNTSTSHTSTIQAHIQKIPRWIPFDFVERGTLIVTNMDHIVKTSKYRFNKNMRCTYILLRYNCDDDYFMIFPKVASICDHIEIAFPNILK